MRARTRSRRSNNESALFQIAPAVARARFRGARSGWAARRGHGAECQPGVRDLSRRRLEIGRRAKLYQTARRRPVSPHLRRRGAQCAAASQSRRYSLAAAVGRGRGPKLQAHHFVWPAAGPADRPAGDAAQYERIPRPVRHGDEFSDPLRGAPGDDPDLVPGSTAAGATHAGAGRRPAAGPQRLGANHLRRDDGDDSGHETCQRQDHCRRIARHAGHLGDIPHARRSNQNRQYACGDAGDAEDRETQKNLAAFAGALAAAKAPTEIKP